MHKREREMSEITNQPLYLIKFDDTEVPDETVFGAEVANKRFEQISGNWNAHLLVKVASNSRDDSCSGSNAKLASDYDALAAQYDEGLAREADLREALRIAETYVQTAFARAQQKDKLGRKLPADHPISADLSRVLAALASPVCADGEKAPTPAINLPRRKVKTEYSTAEEDAQVDAWNAALDAVQELNK